MEASIGGGATASRWDPRWDALLRCPATGQRLHRKGDELRTADGTRAYSIRAGIPRLVAADNALFAALDGRDDGSARGGLSTRLGAVARMGPRESINIG